MIHTLPNGLRLVHIERHSTVAWCGVAIGAGSRDEASGQYGLAHFVEHTIFKGTTHRRAWHIMNRMESIGGELNAYTTKEETMLYTIFPSGHLDRALDLLSDLISHSTFPIDEITREKDVVLEEVASYRDAPAEAIYDDFEDMMFAGSQLGHNVLGVEHDLAKLERQHCLDHINRLYTPDNMVLFYVGSDSLDRVIRLAERNFSMPQRPMQRPDRIAPDEVEPQKHTEVIGSHQAHTIVGARLPGMYSPQRYAIALLNNILGGPGMNSMLNLQLRERRGYVYNVESTAVMFTDCGLMEIYFGCDCRDVKHSLKIIDRITSQLADKPLSERQLEAYKRQYCGQLLVSADSAESVAFNAAKSVLYYDALPDLDALVENIMSVTAQQLMDAAALLTPTKCSILTFK